MAKKLHRVYELMKEGYSYQSAYRRYKNEVDPSYFKKRDSAAWERKKKDKKQIKWRKKYLEKNKERFLKRNKEIYYPLNRRRIIDRVSKKKLEKRYGDYADVLRLLLGLQKLINERVCNEKAK